MRKSCSPAVESRTSFPFDKLQEALFSVGELVCVLRDDDTYEPGRITAVHQTIRGPRYDIRVGADDTKTVVPEEEVSSLAEQRQQGSHFVYEGVRYGTFEELLTSMSSSTPRSEPQDLTAQDVEARVRKLFHEFAGDDAALDAGEFWGLAASVAAELDMDPRRFGDLSVTFDRFDINGDGMLEENECVMLAQSMFRYYVATNRPLTSKHSSSGMFDLEVKNLGAHYMLTQKLGQGGEGTVYMAREVGAGSKRVVKCYDKIHARAPKEEIKEQFKLLRTLDHPRIQRLYDIFEDRSYVYIISEPYYGGHLGHLIENAFEAGFTVTSKYIAKVLYQVLQGVAHLHSRYITHCDLKESNVMITTAEDWNEPAVVVIDFGLAHHFATRGPSGGTPGYMPPEVWTRGLWTPKGDVHSLGVIVYQLFAHGEKCFPGLNDDEIRENTLKMMPLFERITSHWRRCADLPGLVELMLRKELHARPTANECMEHPFFESRVKPDVEGFVDEAVPADAVSALSSLGQRNLLQRAVLTDIATTRNLAELRGLQAAFDAMDADHDGVLTAGEVRTALAGSMEAGKLEEVIKHLVGTDGQIAYTAFMGQLLATKAIDERMLLWREFSQLDTEGTGYLERNQVARLLERPAMAQLLGGRGIEELMALMDENGDGRIVFEEFRRVLSSVEE
mmetsp:Transcript_5879/g.13925  ORF Transcript_5879/g.13925 Transcript_5879/m.13925 type:complete len:675 (+) Transcript_5879:164-2188(+)